MRRRPPGSRLDRSSAASDVYKRQAFHRTSGSSVRHIPCITPELSHFSRSHLWIIFPSLVRDRGIFSLLLLLVPSLFGASSQVALHSAGAECYSSEAWTTPALRPILVLSCPSMRRFACMGNHLDTDALWIAFGYGSSTPPVNGAI